MNDEEWETDEEGEVSDNDAVDDNGSDGEWIDISHSEDESDPAEEEEEIDGKLNFIPEKLKLH